MWEANTFAAQLTTRLQLWMLTLAGPGHVTTGSCFCCVAIALHSLVKTLLASRCHGGTGTC